VLLLGLGQKKNRKKQKGEKKARRWGIYMRSEKRRKERGFPNRKPRDPMRKKKRTRRNCCAQSGNKNKSSANRQVYYYSLAVDSRPF
jgi:hypothetical protein